jgi:hypothetical protein
MAETEDLVQGDVGFAAGRLAGGSGIIEFTKKLVQDGSDIIEFETKNLVQGDIGLAAGRLAGAAASSNCARWRLALPGWPIRSGAWPGRGSERARSGT